MNLPQSMGHFLTLIFAHRQPVNSKEPSRNNIYNLTGSFGGWRRCSLGLAFQALQVRCPKVTCGEASQARHDIGAQMGCSLRESWSRKAVRSMRICASLAPCQPSKSLRHLVNVISQRLLNGFMRGQGDVGQVSFCGLGYFAGSFGESRVGCFFLCNSSRL